MHAFVVAFSEISVAFYTNSFNFYQFISIGGMRGKTNLFSTVTLYGLRHFRFFPMNLKTILFIIFFLGSNVFDSFFRPFDLKRNELKSVVNWCPNEIYRYTKMGHFDFCRFQRVEAKDFNSICALLVSIWEIIDTWNCFASTT